MVESNKNKNCVRNSPQNFSSNSATADNVHLTECGISFIRYWLKNNHVTVDIIYCLRSLLVSGFVLRVLLSKRTDCATALILEGAKAL